MRPLREATLTPSMASATTRSKDKQPAASFEDKDEEELFSNLQALKLTEEDSATGDSTTDHRLSTDQMNTLRGLIHGIIEQRESILRADLKEDIMGIITTILAPRGPELATARCEKQLQHHEDWQRNDGFEPQTTIQQPRSSARNRTASAWNDPDFWKSVAGNDGWDEASGEDGVLGIGIGRAAMSVAGSTTSSANVSKVLKARKKAAASYVYDPGESRYKVMKEGVEWTKAMDLLHGVVFNGDTEMSETQKYKHWIKLSPFVDADLSGNQAKKLVPRYLWAAKYVVSDYTGHGFGTVEEYRDHLAATSHADDDDFMNDDLYPGASQS